MFITTYCHVIIVSFNSFFAPTFPNDKIIFGKMHVIRCPKLDFKLEIKEFNDIIFGSRCAERHTYTQYLSRHTAFHVMPLPAKN